MPLILGANSLTGGYEVDNSLRFNRGSSDYITRTPASASNREKWTLSLWVKRTNLSANDMLFYAHGGGSLVNIAFNGTDTLYMDIGGIGRMFETNAVFRDVSAWYHFVIAFNTTDYSTVSAGQVKVYVNGVEQTFSSTTNMSLSYDSAVNNTTDHTFGRDEGTDSNYANFYLSEINLIDGQQLDPTSFGEFDEDSGIWKPIAYTGTYGTNGFFLEFKDSSALGDDTSGNTNNFTVNNLTSIDQTTDTPTNNFSTLSPLWNSFNQGDLSEGNLKSSMTSGAYKTNLASFGVSQGKWYWEIKLTQASDMNFQLYGVTDESTNKNVDFKASTGTTVYNNTTGKMQIDGSEPGSASAVFAQGDIVGIALNMDDKEISIYKNGSALHSDVTMSTTSNLVFPCHIAYTYSTYIFEYNFGNPPFTISSGNSDANGFGNFEYAVPSGYYALNTKNLAEYG
jgi:hypothetical protein